MYIDSPLKQIIEAEVMANQLIQMKTTLLASFGEGSNVRYFRSFLLLFNGLCLFNYYQVIQRQITALQEKFDIFEREYLICLFEF